MKKMDWTTVTDTNLRAWTIDEELDKKIKDSIDQLSDTINYVSPNCAGNIGASEIDSKPMKLLIFEEMIKNKDWIDRLKATYDELEKNENNIDSSDIINKDSDCLEMIHIDGNDQEGITSNDLWERIKLDKNLLGRLIDLNKEFLMGKESSVNENITTKSSKKIFRIVSNTDKVKHRLGSIKYKPRQGPAIMNISTADWRRMLKSNPELVMEKVMAKPTKFKVTILDDNKDKDKEIPSIHTRPMPSDKALKEIEILNPDKQNERWAYLTPVDLLTDSTPAPESNDVLSDLPSIPRSASLGKLRTVSPRPISVQPSLEIQPMESRPSSANVESNLFSLTQVNSEPTTLKQIPLSPIVVSRLGTGSLSARDSARGVKSLNDRFDAMLTDKKYSPPNIEKSAVLADEFVLSKSYPAPLASSANNSRPSTGTGGSIIDKPKSSKGNKKKDKNKKGSRYDSSRMTSPALSKMGIGVSSGTIDTSINKELFSYKRVKEIRTLRDQLMSTSGSLGLNVHPEANPDNLKDAFDSRLLTMKMGLDTIEKNRHDSTWMLLATPGYLEALGANKIYKTQQQNDIIYDESYEKAVRQYDGKEGIKIDPVREWSESAVKNNVKIFTSGGVMRM
jgi:hypothetical protein